MQPRTGRSNSALRQRKFHLADMGNVQPAVVGKVGRLGHCLEVAPHYCRRIDIR